MRDKALLVKEKRQGTSRSPCTLNPKALVAP